MPHRLAEWIQAYLADTESRKQADEMEEKRAAFRAHFTELERLRQGEITLEQFKKTLDHKTKIKHVIGGKKVNIWGFSGFSGQMFFNQLYNQAVSAGMVDELTAAFLAATEIPALGTGGYRWTTEKLEAFADAVFRTQKAATEKGYPSQKCASVKFSTFFLSFFWNLQDPGRYPIYYRADRDALAYFAYDTDGQERPFDSGSYMRFVRILFELREEIGRISGETWSLPELQHFLFYVTRRAGEIESSPPGKGSLQADRFAQRLTRLLREYGFLVSNAEEVEAVQLELGEEYRDKVIWRFAGSEGNATFAYVFVWDVPGEYICAIHEENEEGFLRKRYTIETEDENTFLKEFETYLARKGDETRFYTLDDMADDTYLPRATLEEWLSLLHEKKQLILYGPPGTGKTYAAQRLAKVIAQNERRVCLIQFHPSYTYEEFIEGLRPEVVEGENGVTHMNVVVRPGVFLELCNEALKQENRECAYVMIIDEINRANTAKVFGELLYALEYRNFPVPLPYSKSKMVVPDNVYIIGTMNTADRSLSQLDFALRRRFPFARFSPYETEQALERYLKRHYPDLAWLAEAVHEANRRIGNFDFWLGHGYFMNRGLSAEKIRRIWKYEIIPYLEEYFICEPERVHEFELEALLAERKERYEGI
ncbi:hypothetical protein ACH33_10185 [Aneurinibacillus sp. XH2]|uniref:McrB family protein n=1 Tax=Aneurinibacillus sp. XH2 TaxID=1450761 RepID=UPI00070BCA29|nr:AAA family ATPase [Aneurinibacillus sp. XH2]AMA73192.1 hypothetical protein ACH33_10185 [Aneurinibacillus sp. XH2]